MKKILILNGSINAANGNTAQVLNHLQKINQENNLASIEIINLECEKFNLKEKMKNADAFIFASGTYWDSWGSPMQKFIEELTELEADPAILFKPAAVIVTMHAFGGKEVVSRLQGILNTMGFLIPPMTGFIYALSTHLTNDLAQEFAADFWSLSDLEIVYNNLITATNQTSNYKAWPVDRKDAKRRWLTCETDLN